MGSSSGGSSSKKSSSSSPVKTVYNTITNAASRLPGGQSVRSTPTANTGGVYRTNDPATQQKIDNFGRLYNEAMGRGDTTSAQAYHTAANQLRDSMGGAGLYNRETGEAYGGRENQTTLTPTANDYGYVGAAELTEPTDYINELKEAQRQSRIASLDKARSAALSSLDTEKANVAPVYYDKRNQAAAASDVGAMNFAQYMAARGIKGAAGAMPEVYRQAGLQGQIGALDRQEAANLAAIERQRANVNTNYESDVAAANADVEAQALQNYINQMNADRAYQLQQAQLTGSLGDTRTLAGQEFDYSKSPSNPEVQYRILANKQMELENAAREIENSYLPETLKMKAKQLEQQVKAGSLDYETAQAQLDVLRRQAKEPYSTGGGLTANQQNQINSKNATNNAILQVSSYGSKAEALAGLQAHGADMIAQGVDIQAVMDAINDRWPY